MDLQFEEIYNSDDSDKNILEKKTIGLMFYDDELKGVDLNSITKNELLKNKAIKNEISYDDILASLNMMVVDGKLQYINPKYSYDKHKQIISNNSNNSYNSYNNSNINNINKYKENTNISKTIIQNSYIQNKYFKNYREPNQPQQRLPPMTREQFRKLQILNILKKRAAQKRINQIKSKKMIFSSNNINFSGGSNGNLNRLFKM
jgi:hypothetical protein